MNVYLLVASGLTAAIWAIHTFAGGPTIARPLVESEKEDVPKYTNYYCWHVVTITLFAMAAGYLYAGLRPGGEDVAVLVTALVAGYFAWGLVLVVWKKQRHVEMPQWILFAILLAVALPGLL